MVSRTLTQSPLGTLEACLFPVDNEFGPKTILALSQPLILLSPVGNQPPCYNSVRRAVKDEYCAVFRLRSG